MKIIKIIITILILFYFSPLKANEDKLQNNITKNLRCLICQGQSVYDSDSDSYSDSELSPTVSIG